MHDARHETLSSFALSTKGSKLSFKKNQVNAEKNRPGEDEIHLSAWEVIRLESCPKEMGELSYQKKKL